MSEIKIPEGMIAKLAGDDYKEELALLFKDNDLLAAVEKYCRDTTGSALEKLTLMTKESRFEDLEKLNEELKQINTALRRIYKSIQEQSTVASK